MLIMTTIQIDDLRLLATWVVSLWSVWMHMSFGFRPTVLCMREEFGRWERCVAVLAQQVSCDVTVTLGHLQRFTARRLPAWWGNWVSWLEILKLKMQLSSFMSWVWWIMLLNWLQLRYCPKNIVLIEWTVFRRCHEKRGTLNISYSMNEISQIAFSFDLFLLKMDPHLVFHELLLSV